MARVIRKSRLARANTLTRDNAAVATDLRTAGGSKVLRVGKLVASFRQFQALHYSPGTAFVKWT